MIKGKQQRERIYVDKPTVNYRKLDALNQSMLKLFDDDPIEFFKQYKLGKKRENKTSTALMIGDLVDFYLLQCRANEEEFHNRFEEKFALYSGAKTSGQVMKLADYLFEITERHLMDSSKSSFEDLFKEAFEKVQGEGFYKKKTMEYALEDFNKNASDYYQMKLDNMDKTVIPQSLVDKALIIANNMKYDSFTADIFQCVMCGDETEYLTHYPIQWRFYLNEKEFVECKSEVDMMFIDHDKKTIQPMDLKTTYDNEMFESSYIKQGYYIQNAFYHKAVTEWAKNEPGLETYKVLPLKFIVGDTSANNRRPLVYETSMEDVKAGMNGFYLRGHKYRGIKELVDDINWAESTNVWNCSRENYEKKGVMKLNIHYD